MFHGMDRGSQSPAPGLFAERGDSPTSTALAIDCAAPRPYQGASPLSGSAMITAATPRRSIDWKQAVYGGLLIALGDALFAIAVWFEWNTKGLTQVFQSIAVGVLGKASYEGGTATALLGAGLHVAMAIAFVAICIALSFASACWWKSRWRAACSTAWESTWR